MTKEDIYKKNKKKAKICKILGPVLFLLFLTVALVFVAIALKNSFGNIVDIVTKLDAKTHTEEQIVDNYVELINKWGEWEIIGADRAGLVIRYVNVANAMFSGIMVTSSILAVVFLLLSLIIGKILLPLLAKNYDKENEELVNLATLRSAAKLDELETVVNKKRIKQKSGKEEWF